MTLRLICTAALLILALGPPSAGAQDRRPPGAPPEPEFMQALFPPQLVMSWQREIGLREDQREAMTRAIQETQGRALEIQWEVAGALRELSTSLEQATVNEDAAVEHAARLINVETQVKLAQLRLLIRIKNLLDDEQQARLRELRKRGPGSAP